MTEALQPLTQIRPGCRWAYAPEMGGASDEWGCQVCGARYTGLELCNADAEEVLGTMLARCDFAPDKFLEFLQKTQASLRAALEEGARKLRGDTDG